MSPAAADRVVVGRRVVMRGGGARPGFVATRGDRIAAVETGASPEAFIGSGTEVIDAGDGLVIPGLHDNHTFFTSQLLEHAGLDAAMRADAEVVGAARSAADSGQRLVVRGVDAARARALRARIEPDVVGADVVLIADHREAIELTAAARRRLGELDPASNESLHALYAQLARDQGAVRRAFTAAAERMHRGGVVSVKDIAFDTHLGMLPTIDRMLEEGALGLRYAFASQAVTAQADLQAGSVWLDRHRDGARDVRRARFHGFKLMTDGSFDERTADLLPPDDPWRLAQRADVDYAALAVEARRVLEAGFRLALNADGDGAARACIDVFESFARDDALPQGSSISDASLVDQADVERLGRLGLVVETYPQLLRFPGYDRTLMERLLGAARGTRLGNLSAMLRAGVRVTGATDFPLFDPSLPEAMLSASERVLGTGGLGERWAPHNAVSREAVLAMWTSAAAAAMGQAGEWGVLTPGASADLVVFDRDLLTVPADELLGAAPTLVIAAGRVVHAA